MKIKEITGYKINNKNLNELLIDLNKINQKAINIVNENIVKNAKEEYDILKKTTHLTSNEIKNKIINKIINSNKRISNGFEINYKYCFHLDLNVYSIEDYLLMEIISDNKNAFENFFEELNYEDYNFKTIEKNPATISQLDWKKREQDWSSVDVLSLEKNAKKGYLYQMVKWLDYEDCLFNNDFFKKIIPIKDY